MKKFFLCTITLFVFFAASAQKPSKKPLDHSVYDGWQSIANQHISNDGNWVLYVVKPQEGDADLFIKNLKNSSKFQLPRADTGRITADSKYAVVLIKPFFQETGRPK